MRKGFTYTDEQLKNAIMSNNTMAGVMRTLGLRPHGNLAKSIKKHAQSLGIDFSHFHYDSNTRRSKIPLEKILVSGSDYYYSTMLKKRLIDSGLLDGTRCAICGIKPFWNGQVLNFQLDHINGQHNDNRIENLRLICPNCHTQCPTFCRGNKTEKSVEPTKLCLDCSTPIDNRSKRCRNCKKHRQKINWPTTSELKEMLEQKSCREVARILGVSDSAIQKHLKNIK